MRKNKNLYWIVPLFIIIALGIFFLLPAKQQTQLASESKYIEVPVFAYMKCEPSQGGQQSITRDFDGTVQTITCGMDNQGNLLGMNNGCSVILKAPNQGVNLGRDYAYRIKRAGQTQYSEQGSVSGGAAGYSGEETTLTLGRFDVLQVAFGFGLFDQPKKEGEIYIVRGDSYTLFNYNSLSATNGQQLDLTRTGNCILEDGYYTNKQIDYYDSRIQELKSTDSKTLDFKNLNQPNGVYTYFSHWTPLPTFASQIETIDGKEAYCMNRKLYETMLITVNGFDYKIVNYDKAGYIRDVACCNGEETPDKLCVNHVFVAKTEAQCDLSKAQFCPQSTFQAYGDKQYKRYSCEDNKCVPEIITVVCNKDADCKSGEVCSRASNPSDNKCVAGGSGAGSTQPKIEDAKSFIVKFKYLFMALAVLTSFLAAFVWSRKNIGFTSTTEKTLAWIIASAYGAIIGLFAFYYLVWTLIGAAAIGILLLVMAFKR